MGHLGYFTGRKDPEPNIPMTKGDALRKKLMAILGQREIKSQAGWMSDIYGFDPEFDKPVNLSLFDELETPEEPQKSQTPPSITAGADVDVLGEPVDSEEAVDKELNKPLTVQTFEKFTNEEKDVFVPLDTSVLDKQVEQKPVPELENFVNNIFQGAIDSGSATLKSIFTLNGYLADLVTGEKVGSNSVVSELINREVIGQFDEFIDYALPTNNESSFWGTKLPNAIGTGLFFIAGGLAGSGIKLGTKLTPAQLGALSTSQSWYEEAKQSGATDEEIFINYLSGIGFGSTEAFGIGGIVGRISKLSGRNLFVGMLREGFEEGGQETLQTVGQNLTAKETYDLSRELLKSVPDNLAVALVTGGLFGAGATAINNLSKDPNLSRRDKKYLEEATKNFEEINKTFTANLTEPKNPDEPSLPPAGSRLFNEPLPEAQQIARQYEQNVGIEGGIPQKITKIDTDRSKRIAQEFESLPLMSDDPDTKASYDAMVKETTDQFKAIRDAGYNVEINDNEPYENSQEMIEDLRKNKRLKIFSTESGFGKGKVEGVENKPVTKREGSFNNNTISLIVSNHNKYGGSTTTPEGSVEQGYAVSIFKNREQVIDGKTVSEEQIKNFLEKNRDVLSQSNTAVGTWYDESTGKTYLDISVVAPSESEAHQIADENNQKAIFDLGEKREIKSGKNKPKDIRLQDSGFKDVNGKPLLNNDVFRFVHDFFGHAQLGNSFGAIGEENAWRVHSRMYSPLARRAMTTETRGQNSWVNFSGVNEEAFRLRGQARELRKQGKTEEANELSKQVFEQMKFAEQKMALLPEIYSKLDEELEQPVPQNSNELRDSQNAIPKEFQIPVYRYSSKDVDGFTTDPEKFGSSSIARNEVKASGVKRTPFYLDPQDVNLDTPSLRNKNLYVGTVDSRNIYDLSTDPDKLLQNEYGVNDIDSALRKIKEAGFKGVKYNWTGGKQLIAMFEPVAVDRPNIPTIGTILSEKWKESVEDAKKRLNGGHYQVLSSIPFVGGFNIIQDLGIIMTDYVIKKGIKLSKINPNEFFQTMVEALGEQARAFERFARDVYETVKQMRRQYRESSLFDEEETTPEQIDAIKSNVTRQFNTGENPEYIPTGNGIVIIGGDALDFEGNRRKAVGTRFPEDQALKAGREKPRVIVDKKEDEDFDDVVVKSPYGKIESLEGNRSLIITGAFVGEVDPEAPVEPDMSAVGQEYGLDLYEELIEYARSKKKAVQSDTFLTSFSYGMWNKLKRMGYPVEEMAEDVSEVKNEMTGEIIGYSAKSSIFRLDTSKMPEPKKRRGASYPVWATNKVVARQIEKEAVKNGNDSIVFVQYPNVWNSVRVNYEFQKLLQNRIQDEIKRNGFKIKLPKLPTVEQWNPPTGSKDSKTEELRDKYYMEIQQALNELRLKKEGRDEQKMWTKESLGLEFARDNSINLSGKILGTAKFKQLNHGSNRISPHKIYDTEIEGYNFRMLPQPIAFDLLQKETKGTDVGIRGEKMKSLAEKEKEQYRRTQMFREMRQRGLVISREQSDLTDALLQFSNGQDEALYNWMDKNPEWKDYIIDWEKHKQWMEGRKDIDKILSEKADKQLRDVLPKAYYTGINPVQAYKSLAIWGKAIARGTKNFGQWAGKMVQQFGDWIRPLLRDIWTSVSQMPNIFKKTSSVEAEKIKQEQKNVSMENTNPTSTGAKKDKTYTWNYQKSVTKGYNESREHPLVGEHIARIVETIRTEFDVRRRGTISNEDLIKIAKDKASQLTDSDILDMTIGDIKNAEDALAMRIYITDQLLKINDEIKKFATDSDPLVVSSMTSEFARVMRMWMAVRALGTEMGRGVQSFNIPMDDNIIDGMKSLVDELRKHDPEGRYGGDAVADAIEEITGANKEKALEKPSLWEKARFLFINYILQNPFTDLANVFGNSSSLGFHITANIGNLGGAKTLANGLRKGFKEGIKNALQVLHGEREAISKFTEGSQVTVPSTEKRSKKNWLKLLVPTTRLGMEDAFFRALVKNVELERMSYKLGNKLSIHPNEIYESVQQIINDPALAEFQPKQVRDMVEYLENIEDELVFQKELGKIGKGLSMVSRVAFPIMPFVTTPLNILKMGVKATPLGFTQLLKKDISPEEKNQIIRRALAGSVFLSGLGAMVASGLVQITGGGSDDPYERDLMAKMGYKPYHLYINTPFGMYGGSYQSINPMNISFTIVGDLMDKYRFRADKEIDNDKEWYDKAMGDASTALIGLAGSITDQSFLVGTRDFVDWLAGRKPDWAMRMLTNFGRVGMVNAYEKISGTEDRGQYDTRGRMLEQLQKNSPLSNEGLIPSVSAFGEQRQNQYERFPVPLSELNPDPKYKWLADNGLQISIPSRTTKIGNRELSRREYAFYSETVGKMMDKAVEQVYTKATDKEREEEMTLEDMQEKLDSAYKSAKTRAMEMLKTKILNQYKLLEGEEK